LIFVKNITRANFFLDLKSIDETKYRELIPHSVKALDLLITKMGDPPGDCEIYPENAPSAVLTADCLKFRLWDEFANRKLYKFCINSNFVKRQLGLITKGVAQKKISVERFKTVCLPFFSVEEQQMLVQEIESKLSECDQLDQTITTSLQQAEALRQSVLKKALSGRLVPQDPHDEPASALLARIKAERADVAAKPRKKSVGYKLSPTDFSPSINKES
jgi:type I restriction enzyme S subunit